MGKYKRPLSLPIFFVLLSACSMIAIHQVWSPLVPSLFDSSGVLSSLELLEDVSISNAIKAAGPPGGTSILPSKMEIHYHEMWNHTTNTIDVPEKYRNPFNLTVIDETGNRRRPWTSLEILDIVLNGAKYRDQFEAVEAYMEGKSNEIPQCLLPNVDTTRKLANKVVLGRNEPKAANQSPLQLPLPFLNVGFPKVGTNTLMEYFDCLGIMANHGQNGQTMFNNLEKGINLYATSINSLRRHNIMAYTQLDRNIHIGYYPQVSLLDELHELNPNSTLIFNFRQIHDWIHSVTTWNVMRGQMSRFYMPGLILNDEQRARNEKYKDDQIVKKNKKLQVTDLQLAKWWCSHALHIREYVREYPTHSLIELDLYDNNGTSNLLHDLFQVDANTYWENERKHNTELPERPKQCWGHGNKSPDKNLSLIEKNELNKLRKREKRKQREENVYMVYKYY